MLLHLVDYLVAGLPTRSSSTGRLTHGLLCLNIASTSVHPPVQLPLTCVLFV